jgi:hypothetical protein
MSFLPQMPVWEEKGKKVGEKNQLDAAAKNKTR